MSMRIPMHKLREHPLDMLVIGGSAGVLDVLRVTLKALPAELRMPVAVVVHLPPRTSTALHESLRSITSLSMQQAEDKEPLRNGHIYFAPAGYHLLIESDRCCALSVDEPVHYSRPSIDVLFESASEVYGANVMGILLTGASADGAAGLRAIHAAGGITVVQDPETSEASTMPQSAIDLFTPDFVLAPQQIAALLSNLNPNAHA